MSIFVNLIAGTITHYTKDGNIVVDLKVKRKDVQSGCETETKTVTGNTIATSSHFKSRKQEPQKNKEGVGK